MIGETNINGGAGLNGKGALLKIKAKTGSTITVSKGSYFKTIKVSWLDSDDNNWSYWLFQTTDFGEWTVTATLKTDTVSDTVTILDNKQYDLTIYMPIYLVKNGTKITDFTGQSYTKITQQTGYVNFYVTQNVAATFTSTDPVDLTKYSQISITIPNNGISYYRSGVEPSVVIGNPRPIFSDQESSTTNKNFSFMKMLSSNTTITANTYTLDISNVSGAYYIGVAIGGSASIRASLDISEWVVTA